MAAPSVIRMRLKRDGAHDRISHDLIVVYRGNLSRCQFFSQNSCHHSRSESKVSEMGG